MKTSTKRAMVVVLCWIPAVVGLLLGVPLYPTGSLVTMSSSHGGERPAPLHMQVQWLAVLYAISLGGLVVTIILRVFLDRYWRAKTPNRAQVI